MNFTTEVTVIWSYLFLRVDQGFYGPDGANGDGEYSGMVEVGGWAKGKEERSALGGGSGSEKYVSHSLQRTSRESEYSRGHVGGKWEKEHIVLLRACAANEGQETTERPWKTQLASHTFGSMSDLWRKENNLKDAALATFFAYDR